MDSTFLPTTAGATPGSNEWMPAKNRRQQKALYAKKGEAWVKAHHFDRIAGKSKLQKPKRKKR